MTDDELEAVREAERMRWKAVLEGVTPQTPQYARAIELLSDTDLSAEMIRAQLPYAPPQTGVRQ